MKLLKLFFFRPLHAFFFFEQQVLLLHGFSFLFLPGYLLVETLLITSKLSHMIRNPPSYFL